MYQKHNTSSTLPISSSSSSKSSYSSGTASIIVSRPDIETPPRTSSLHFRQILSQSPPSSLLSLFEDEFEDIDLVADDDSSSTSSSTRDNNVSTNDLSMDSMSSIIATALQLSSMEGKSLSSLSSGNASIIRSKSLNNTNTKMNNRLSSRFFSWGKSKRHSAPTKPTQQPSTSLPSRYDDGKAELIYRGIQVKEIQSTLDPIVLSSLSCIYPDNGFHVYDSTEFTRY